MHIVYLLLNVYIKYLQKESSKSYQDIVLRYQDGYKTSESRSMTLILTFAVDNTNSKRIVSEHISGMLSHKTSILYS